MPKYVNIGILPETRNRFVRRVKANKKDHPYYYADTYLNDLMNLEDKLKKGGK